MQSFLKFMHTYSYCIQLELYVMVYFTCHFEFKMKFAHAYGRSSSEISTYNYSKFHSVHKSAFIYIQQDNDLSFRVTRPY